MKLFNCVFGIVLIFSAGSVSAQYNFQDLGNGWKAMTMQSDPFDSSKVEVIEISKESFKFRCNELNMKAYSSSYDGFSIGANLKYVVDARTPVDKKGSYSSYLGGSDLVTKDKYYFFKLKSSDLEAFKNGNTVKVAGKFSNEGGWITNNLDLSGFTDAYNLMCN